MTTDILDKPVAAETEALTLTKGQYVVVRTYAAGVHAGIYQGHSGQEVTLTQSRRLWRWHAAKGISLSGVATHGIVASKSRIEHPVPKIALLDAIEIIPASDEAAASITDAPHAAA